MVHESVWCVFRDGCGCMLRILWRTKKHCGKGSIAGQHMHLIKYRHGLSPPYSTAIALNNHDNDQPLPSARFTRFHSATTTSKWRCQNNPPASKFRTDASDSGSSVGGVGPKVACLDYTSRLDLQPLPCPLGRGPAMLVGKSSVAPLEVPWTAWSRESLAY